MSAWTFSALGFAVLWRATGRDVLPYPLQFRPAADTTDDFDTQWKATAGELAERVERDPRADELEAAVRILHGPEARIEISGFAGATTASGDLLRMGDPRRRVRTLAAVHYRHATVITQEPTDDPENGGRVRISLLRSDDLTPRLLAATLPPTTRGTNATVRVQRSDLPTDNTPFTAFPDNSSREKAPHFFNRPRTTILYIAVYPGPAPDRRPTPTRDFHIVDYPDGRYLLRHNKTVLRADPATPHLLTTHLQSLLDTTLTAFREDNDPHYNYD
ncbi:ESX secretion-associated protein EspG [Nocardia terpenica]|uniref:ESX secretion-associated protein EspG n=1 Tax=Nocardia terpenica TaxID=455432 RepID=UPI001893B424|nr:ESX secretion-associated protein EspG [Nocardia terpenica]MBF6063726.1 ESX secretion-associated protein EspG [Nocardia terpenica]MBF6107102.1 ESX secretion-associated protein EspG [Nocardia terpenica]MBF6114275.1 ESX secretion-associated protein EspG [Nocardia terpenica]MBF6121638.1 ESX secretion-associated protein EspG [Nocardia terpenica]MBF6154053.1 ESX secretion-associated protein EspG [Nocardia terpenica]